MDAQKFVVHIFNIVPIDPTVLTKYTFSRDVLAKHDIVMILTNVFCSKFEIQVSNGKRVYEQQLEQGIPRATKSLSVTARPEF